MQHAGDPTHNAPGLLPYDFWGLRHAVDIWEPEAYGRIGDWERVKAGRFTADYARLCNPNLPIVWAEIGNSVWDMARMAPPAHHHHVELTRCTDRAPDFRLLPRLHRARHPN